MYWLPVLGAVALGGGTVLQKHVLKHKRVSTRLYQVAMFLVIVIIMLPLLYFFWKFDSGALEFWNVVIFLAVIGFSVLANVFALYAMKWEKVENLEPAKVLEPLFVILLAIMFSYIFGTELFARNTKVIIPAFIAVGALVFSHVKKHHFDMNKYFLAAIVGSFFYASELVISMLVLDFYSPISFYFLRSLGVFFISFLIFRPHFSKLSRNVRWEIFFIGLIWVFYRVAVYYGYLSLGVISTTLVFMLGPIFVYAFAYKFLREKIHWRNLVASMIIVACVLYAVLT